MLLILLKMNKFSVEHKADKSMMDFIMLGDSAVGKSSLLDTFHGQEFPNQRMPTLGIDYFDMNFTPNSMTSPQTVRLWDTAGQERLRSLP